MMDPSFFTLFGKPTCVFACLIALAGFSAPHDAVAQGCKVTSPTDFFPLQVGNRWTYTYTTRDFSPFGSSEGEGRLTLEIVAQNCDPTGDTYTVTEHKAGIQLKWNPFTSRYDTSGVDETRQFILVEHESQITMGTPYADAGKSFVRFEPIATSDTLAYRDQYTPNCGSRRSSSTKLVRGVGIVSHSYGGSATSNSCSFSMNLEEASVATSSTRESSLSTSVVLSVYPIPASRSVTVRAETASGETVHVMLVSLSGQVIKEIRRAASSETLDLSDVAPGVYLVRAATHTHTSVQQIVVLQ